MPIKKIETSQASLAPITKAYVTMIINQQGSKKPVAEQYAEQRLKTVMRKAKEDAMRRRKQAESAHMVRMRDAIQAGVARRAEIKCDW